MVCGAIIGWCVEQLLDGVFSETASMTTNAHITVAH